MPIPKVNRGEKEKDYMSRCMSDTTMVSEYDTDQRVAICLTQFRNKKEHSVSLKSEIRKDVFTSDSEAQARADEIGCTGTHTHDADGTTVYMPCASHADYRQSDINENEGTLNCEAELKAYEDDDTEKGEFTGYASIFGNVDLGNDVVERGAFTKSLRRKGYRKVKMLYQHDTKQPIGVFDMIKEDENGLFVKGRLAMQTQKGKEVFELMKMGAIDGLSVGYRVDQKGYSCDDKKGKRRLKEVDLMEISAVTFPMNPKAMIQGVKSDSSIREWETHMREVCGLSRSEAKMTAKAVVNVLSQRDVDDSEAVVTAITNLTQLLKR
jgi:HK97 family phage prohead protease